MKFSRYFRINYSNVETVTSGHEYLNNCIHIHFSNSINIFDTIMNKI